VRRRPSDGSKHFGGAPQPERVIGYGHKGCESQLALVRLHEELESSADAAFLVDALGEFLVEVLFEIAQGMKPIGVFGKT
jgi:hypothetical protein